MFLGYSLNSSSCKVYNVETMCVEKSSNVVFIEVKKEIEIDYD